MRTWVVVAAAGLAIGTAARAADDADGGPTFLSPMGEPFRGTVNGASPQARWFAAADLDHDGRLTVEEMRRDAARFFATLDTNHDGEIDPDELTRYETEVAPEIEALLSMSGSRNTAQGSGDSPEPRAKGADGYPDLHQGGDDKGGKPRRRRRREELPTTYLALTEPIASADRNLDRGVSRAEFDTAAQSRFRLLDRDNHGYLTLDGLRSLQR